MKYSLFIGRWQCIPLHEGHIKLIRTVLDEGKNVAIAIRNTAVDENNPYSTWDRAQAIRDAFVDEFTEGSLIIFPIPDIEAVCYGRGVGYEIREIKLCEKTEKISATEIRRKLCQKDYKVKNEES